MVPIEEVKDSPSPALELLLKEEVRLRQIEEF